MPATASSDEDEDRVGSFRRRSMALDSIHWALAGEGRAPLWRPDIAGRQPRLAKIFVGMTKYMFFPANVELWTAERARLTGR